MIKKISFLAVLFFSVTVFAKDYTNNQDGIHATTLESGWCENLAVSTKVGHLSDSGQCIYQRETTPQGFGGCGPLSLDGVLLESSVGQGFNCAATHVHSNIMSRDGFDEYKLISDSSGHYVNTESNKGNINLG